MQIYQLGDSIAFINVILYVFHVIYRNINVEIIIILIVTTKMAIKMLRNAQLFILGLSDVAFPSFGKDIDVHTVNITDVV